MRLVLDQKNFDRAWYVVAAISVACVFFVANSAVAQGVLGCLTLGLALSASCYLMLFVERRTTGAADDVAVSCDTPIVHATTLPKLDASESPAAASNLYISWATSKAFALQAQAAAETNDQRTAHLSEHVEERLRAVLQTHRKLIRDSRLAERRNVLREARELAEYMRGKDMAVLISPDSELAICDKSATREWTVVAPQKEAGATTMNVGSLVN